MATITLRPNSDGYCQLSKNSGTIAYNRVNEVTADGNSTYLFYTSTSTYLNLYQLVYLGLDISSLPSNAVIDTTTVHAVARTVNTTDIGHMSLSVGLGTPPTQSADGLNYGTEVTLTTSYAEYSATVVPVTPTVGGAQTDNTLFVAAKISVSKNSVSAKNASELRITQMYVDVTYHLRQTEPSIASATMTPNPVDIGNTVLISVDVQEI